MEKYLNTSLYADCPSHVYDYGRRPPRASMPPILRMPPLTSLEVLWQLQTPGTRLRGVASLMDGAVAGTWRGETDASGLHGGDLAVGLARMLLPGVPMGRPNTTGWRGPLVKACPWEVKGLDLVVNRMRVRRDGGPGGSNATGASHRALIHAGGVVACLKRRHTSPGCGPPHGRRRHRHLEGGNGRVGSTRRGCSSGFGPDVAPRCPYGLT
jgi:hypothetical protein